MSDSIDSTEQIVASEEEMKLLDDPALYINRELSWLKVNERILEEANDSTHPLLERIKFLAICGSNLDEFFMVRVSGLKQQLLQGEGIVIKKVEDLDKSQRNFIRSYFDDSIFPTLTPLAMDFAHPFPFISNLSINLAVIVRDSESNEKYARVKIPTNLFPRLVEIPDRRKKSKTKIELKKERNFVFIEDVIASEIDKLFPGLVVVATYPFRITRNAEIMISNDLAPDLLTAMEVGIESRRTGFPIRLETDKSMPDDLKNLFFCNLWLTNDLVYDVDLPLAIADFWQFLDIDRPDLKDTPGSRRPGCFSY
jgi:polyphosphate kinase